MIAWLEFGVERKDRAVLRSSSMGEWRVWAISDFDHHTVRASPSPSQLASTRHLSPALYILGNQLSEASRDLRVGRAQAVRVRARDAPPRLAFLPLSSPQLPLQVHAS